MMNRQLSKVALVTIALAITACTNTIQPAVPTGSASPAAPEATPSGLAPSTIPSGSAGPDTSATASPNVADPVVAKPVVISGMVYDEKGALVDGAKVTIRSLNAAAKYEATASASAGSWVVNNVPEGVNVEIVVTKDGWTSRKRVGSFQAAANQRNTMDFGAPSNQAGNAGAAFFISDRPEIEATEPVNKAEDQDAAMLTYKLRLSEPLSETGRKRLEDALRVFPANAAASPNAAAADLENATDTGALAIEASYDYAIKKGTTFLGDSSTAASVSWNEARTEATFSFQAPLIANKSEAAKYQVGLVAGSAASPLIEDLQGKQLGTSDAGSLTAYPAAGNLIRNVFKELELALEGSPTTDEDRWNATHDSVATFKLKKDATAPKLAGIQVRTVGDDTRIELAFSEPMAAYDDTDGYQHATLTNLANYSFMIGERAADLDGTLKGEAGAPNVDPTAEALFGDQAADQEEEFRLVDADGDMSDNDDAGDVSIQVDPRDAKTVWITIHDRADWFDDAMGAIKARVEGIADPAGNAITDAEADRTNVLGDL